MIIVFQIESYPDLLLLKIGNLMVCKNVEGATLLLSIVDVNEC